MLLTVGKFDRSYVLSVVRFLFCFSENQVVCKFRWRNFQRWKGEEEGGSCVKIMVAMQCKGLVKSGEIKTE